MNALRNKPKDLSPPFVPTFSRVRDEVERAFDRFIRDPLDLVVHPERKAWMPALDMIDNESEIIVRAEVPGMNSKDINLSISGNRLTLSGQKEEHKDERTEGWYISERSFGSFSRVIELPEGLDAERVTADQTDGLLTIRIAKLRSVKPKHIPIKVHSP